MKTLQFYRIIRVLFLVCACFIGEINHTLADQTEVWGMETNGISAGIRDMSFGGAQEVWVTLKLFTGNSVNPLDLQFTNVSKSPFWWRFKYFKATNSFCGPIELQDATGHEVPLLKPEIDDLEAYPTSYSLKAANYILTSKYHGFYSGPPLPTYLRLPSNTLCSFYLKDYFKLEKPGKYKLTVWPKIYKRVSPTNNICQRIDIPPVTVTINWQGKASDNAPKKP